MNFSRVKPFPNPLQSKKMNLNTMNTPTIAIIVSGMIIIVLIICYFIKNLTFKSKNFEINADRLEKKESLSAIINQYEHNFYNRYISQLDNEKIKLISFFQNIIPLNLSVI